MSTTPDLEAQELIHQLRAEWARGLEAGLLPFNSEIAALKTRLSRPPGSDGTPTPLAHSMARALHGEPKFLNWLKEPHSNRSHFETEVPFIVKTALETKASPITGVDIAEAYRVLAGPPQPALRVGQLMPRIPITSGGSVTYTREKSFVPAADLVPEATLKPESTLTFENVTETFATIATWVRVSLQSLADTPAMTTWIDSRLSYAVLLREEQYLLNGPAGLLALAGALDAAYTPGTGATQLDMIGAAIGQLEAQGYTVDGIVLNGVDASKTRLLKSTQGEYIWADPDSPVGTSQMWSIPVVLSPSLAAGTFLVGAFAQGCVLFDRQMLTVQISYEDQDNFVKNLATIRGEERAALAIPLPQALIKGTFTGTVAEGAHGAPVHNRK